VFRRFVVMTATVGLLASAAPTPANAAPTPANASIPPCSSDLDLVMDTIYWLLNWRPC
jgi:hypothetical protein